MAKYFDMLMEDVRMKEGLQSCMNCGVCTGVCPAAEFYNYDPRQIVNIVQTRDDDAIEEHSDRKARELGYEEGADQKYMMDVFLNNSNEHY